MIEIEDSRTDYASYTNLYASGKIEMWNQYSEGGEELSILSGHVEAGSVNLLSGAKINMKNGIFHAGGATALNAQVNMLSGGTGDITIDDCTGDDLNAFYVNWVSGNQGSVTFGAIGGTNSSDDVTWAIVNGRFTIDGGAATLSDFELTVNGTATTVTLMVPEPATVGLFMVSGCVTLFLRRLRFG
jgi:hypothetical protein